MAVTLGGINVNFGANLGPLQSGISSAQGLIGGFGVAAAAAMVGFGVASVQAAGSFQSGLTSLVTGAGEAQSNLKMVGDGILNLSTATGTSTKQLTDGMYMIESAGYHGSAGLSVLKAAAEGAKVGNADLGVVADATTTIMTDFGLKSNQAGMAVNTLTATVASGKTTMQALSASLSSILPTASAAKVGLNDVMGAMATMTGEGVPAANAATFLRQMLMALENPSTAAATALKSVGLTSTQVADEMHTSLPGAVQMITDALAKKFPVGSQAYVKALSDISGGSKQMQAMLDLSGQHLQTFKDNVVNVSAAVKKGGDSINGWSQVQGNFNQQMAQLGAAVNVVEIKLGTALLPTLTKIATQITPLVLKFADWVQTSGAIPASITSISTAIAGLVTGLTVTINLISSVVTFFQKNQVAADLLAGAVVGLTVALIAFNAGAIIAAVTAIPAVVIGFGAWAVAAGIAAIATLAAASPFIAIGIVVAVVVAGIILAVQHWGEIAHWLQGVWSGIAGFFSGLWKGIQGVFGNIGSWFQTQFGNAKNAAQSGWDNTVSFFKGVGQNIVSGWQGTVNNVVGAFQWLYNHNYYFKDLVDAITNWTKSAQTWLQNAWKSTSDWLGTTWKGISATSSSVWSGITGTTQTATTATGNAIHTGWTGISNFMGPILASIGGAIQTAWTNVSNATATAWNAVSGWVVKAWQTISSVIGGAWGTYIAGPLGGIGTSIGSWFSNLAGQAVQFGRNLIQGFINGIGSMIGAVGQAASNVVGTVTNFLGFHSPAKMGPGKDADKWGPNLVNMFAGGIMAGVPQVARASAMLLSPLAVASGGNVAVNTSGSSYPLQGSSGGGGASQASGDQHIHIMFDGNEMAHYIGKKQQKLMYLHTGIK